ncbi:MAG: glycosyltransferase family 2 protein [Verrucomicrobiota bacterium]
MPVYNEVATVREVAMTVLKQPLVGELIMVDDASTDGTWDILEELNAAHPSIRIFKHAQNQGKGAALKTGFSHISLPYAIIQDADFEYDPEEYPILLTPILDGKADVVYGSRFCGAGAHRVLYFWHFVGNTFLTLLSNMLTNINLTDMETCFKAFRKEVITQIDLQEPRFGVEPEITAKIAKLGVRIYEVPVSYYGRTYAEGKKISWRDGFSALRCILRYNLLP